MHDCQEILFVFQAEAEAAALEGSPPEGLVKSPSGFSRLSYELFVGQDKMGEDRDTKDRGSIKSENGESSDSRSHMNGKVRKVREKLILFVVDEEQQYKFVGLLIQIEMLLNHINSLGR